MANLRQTILVRTDLNFPVGLMCAQVAHIHMERFRQQHVEAKVRDCDPTVHCSDNDMEWFEAPYVFVHGVPNKESLLHFIAKAEETEGVEVTAWEDTVYSKVGDDELVFDTLIGASLGPCDSDLIKKVIGKLPLL